MAGRLHEARSEYRCLAAATDDFDILLQLRQGQPFGRQRVGMRSALLRPIAQGDNGRHERYRKRGARLQALALVGKRGPHVDARRGDIDVTAAVRIRVRHQVAIDSGNGNHLFVCCGITRRCVLALIAGSCQDDGSRFGEFPDRIMDKIVGRSRKAQVCYVDAGTFQPVERLQHCDRIGHGIAVAISKEGVAEQEGCIGHQSGRGTAGLPASREKTPVP